MTIIEITAVATAIAALLGVIGSSIAIVFKLGSVTATMTQSLKVQNDMIAELKTEIGKLGMVLTEVAVQKKTIERLEQWYDELRRGEGFVFPLTSHLGRPPGS